MRYAWVCLLLGAFSFAPGLARPVVGQAGSGGLNDRIDPERVRTNRVDPDEPRRVGVVAIPAGTPVLSANDAGRFNRLLLMATPVLDSGDVDAIASTGRKLASELSLTMMATVSGNEATGFQLDEVGMGYAHEAADGWTVVTSQGEDETSNSLGFFERQVLAENEQRLEPPSILIRSTTLVLFDVGGWMNVGQSNVRRIFRQLVWVHPKTGRLAMAVWLLRPASDSGSFPTVDERKPIRLVAEQTRERRRIHVDGRRVFLTLPGAGALALTDLPPGRSVEWTDDLRGSLATPMVDQEQLASITDLLNVAIGGP